MQLEPEPSPWSTTPADPAPWGGRLGDRREMRWEKIARARRALSSGAYAVEEALDAILEPLAAELGLACRDDGGADGV